MFCTETNRGVPLPFANILNFCSGVGNCSEVDVFIAKRPNFIIKCLNYYYYIKFLGPKIQPYSKFCGG